MQPYYLSSPQSYHMSVPARRSPSTYNSRGSYYGTSSYDSQSYAWPTSPTRVLDVSASPSGSLSSSFSSATSSNGNDTSITSPTTTAAAAAAAPGPRADVVLTPLQRGWELSCIAASHNLRLLPHNEAIALRKLTREAIASLTPSGVGAVEAALRHRDRARPKALESAEAGGRDGVLWRLFAMAVELERLTGLNELSKITSYLYVSSSNGATRWDALNENGITDVITCMGSPLAESDKSPGITYHYYAASDVDSFLLAVHFSNVARLVQRIALSGRRAVVHCTLGVSRSTSLATASLMWGEQLSCNEALATVQRGRPMAAPNFGFRLQLLFFEHLLANDGRTRIPDGQALRDAFAKWERTWLDMPAAERHSVLDMVRVLWTNPPGWRNPLADVYQSPLLLRSNFAHSRVDLFNALLEAAGVPREWWDHVLAADEEPTINVALARGEHFSCPCCQPIATVPPRPHITDEAHTMRENLCFSFGQAWPERVTVTQAEMESLLREGM